MEEKKLKEVYNSAIEEAKRHYENFPVVSVFLRKRLLPHVALFYVFARRADDIADEGNLTVEERLGKLRSYRNALSSALSGTFVSPFWEALSHTISKFDLTPQYFYDLLHAFEIDVLKKRFDTQEELYRYCRLSANPVGRVMLEFYGIRSPLAFSKADAITTALQLTNFWQDVSVDLQKGRIYLPLEIMKKFDYSEEKFLKKEFDFRFAELMRYEIGLTEKMFREGRELLNFLPFGLKIQINATIYGGLEILKKIKRIGFNVLNYRVKLNKMNFIWIFTKAFLTLE
jgi:squalene synthase HpnC